MQQATYQISFKQDLPKETQEVIFSQRFNKQMHPTATFNKICLTD